MLLFTIFRFGSHCCSGTFGLCRGGGRCGIGLWIFCRRRTTSHRIPTFLLFLSIIFLNVLRERSNWVNCERLVQLQNLCTQLCSGHLRVQMHFQSSRVRLHLSFCAKSSRFYQVFRNLIVAVTYYVCVMLFRKCLAVVSQYQRLQAVLLHSRSSKKFFALPPNSRPAIRPSNNTHYASRKHSDSWLVSNLCVYTVK